MYTLKRKTAAAKKNHDFQTRHKNQSKFNLYTRLIGDVFIASQTSIY